MYRSSSLRLLGVSVFPRCSYSTQPPKWMGGRFIKGRSHLKGKPPSLAKCFAEKMTVFEERLAGETAEKMSVNIGVPFTSNQGSVDNLKEVLRRNRRNAKMERAARLCNLEVPLDEVKTEWQQTLAPLHARILAEHYGIFRDLFAGAFFFPVLNLDVTYDVGDDFVLPVHKGNKITPSEAMEEPEVDYSAETDTLWTLLMTNPDTHLTDNSAEYIHWFIGNIPGNQVSEGDVLCDYLQPFPPCGTGLHRHVFILFKQNQQIDYSQLKRPSNCRSLEQRTFSTYDFYQQHQDQLTPMGLCFFQSEYDQSVKHTYHEVLDMREPTFEYKHPVCYHPLQKTYPHKEPFDRYYDRYRERKDIDEEVLKIKLEKEAPFQEPQPEPPYPLVHLSPTAMPSWLRYKQQLIARRVEQYKDV